MNMDSLIKRAMKESSPTALLLIDQAKKILHTSAAAERLLRKKSSELLGKSISFMFPSLTTVIEQTLVQHENSFGHEVALDGIKLCVDLLTAELEHGARVLICVIRRMQWGTLESLDLFKTHFPAILDSFRDGIWICNNRAEVLLVNLASEKINGIKARDVLGKSMVELHAQGLVDRSIAELILKEQCRKSLIQQTDEGKQILVAGYPVFNDEGEMVLLVVTERDLTKLTRLRMELEKSRSLAREYCTEISHLLTEQSELSEVVARSSATHRCLRTALKVAGVDSNVVMEGESGVGKSLFASLIHRNSMVKDGPFIQVDCGAIPESLIESELFGYEPGAFTGARDKGKTGLFELADGGTLFLDEVGELPLAMQVKLLRFVESNEFLRVGGTKPRRVQVRILAATNRNLSHMVKEGLFREDLFFRLNVVPLRIPPLRERLEDIPPLCVHILEKFKETKGIKKRLSPEVLDRLMMHDFPGNVRELINLMERMIVMSESDVISLSDLPRKLRSLPMAEMSDSIDLMSGNLSLKAAVDAFEVRVITSALHRSHSMAGAARELGTKSSTLWRKAKRLGIKPSQ